MTLTRLFLLTLSIVACIALGVGSAMATVTTNTNGANSNAGLTVHTHSTGDGPAIVGTTNGGSGDHVADSDGDAGAYDSTSVDDGGTPNDPTDDTTTDIYEAETQEIGGGYPTITRDVKWRVIYDGDGNIRGIFKVETLWIDHDADGEEDEGEITVEVRGGIYT